jgi:ABC-type sugar transport system ATPase subunit
VGGSQLTANPLLRVRHLSKSFPGVRALDDVSFDVHAGEILALVGQNGSGKSTLVKILAGVHGADPGSSVTLRAQDEGAEDAAQLHFIHQDLGLVPMLSAIENIDLGQPLGRRGYRPSPLRRERHHAERLLAKFDVQLDVRAPVGELSPAERTIVAIVRALDGWKHLRNVLVLDEPTAALHGDEVRRLLDVVRRVARNGAGVIYISHRLDEVIELADEVMVLRDGRLVARAPRGAFDHDALVRMIAGEISPVAPARARSAGRVRLEVRGLSCPAIRRADLQVRAGEIVGVTGILGSGRERLAGALFGADPGAAGSVLVDGRRVAARSPSASIAAGMAYVPADRHRDGGLMTLTARENLTLPFLAPLTGNARGIDRREERREARHWFARVGLRPLEPERPLNLFSGGNQQKVVLARWMRTEPIVLLLDEPTHGVDVGAKEAIHALVSDAAAGGAAVLVTSSDVKELARLCDRVLVMREGRIADDLHGTSLSESRLTAEALGVRAADLDELFGSISEGRDECHRSLIDPSSPKEPTQRHRRRPVGSGTAAC